MQDADKGLYHPGLRQFFYLITGDVHKTADLNTLMTILQGKGIKVFADREDPNLIVSSMTVAEAKKDNREIVEIFASKRIKDLVMKSRTSSGVPWRK